MYSERKSVSALQNFYGSDQHLCKVIGIKELVKRGETSTPRGLAW